MDKKSAYTEFYKLTTEDGSLTDEQIGVLVLNRPHAANAFDNNMIKDITHELKKVQDNSLCRLLVIQGTSRYFSAGSDLEWMKRTSELPFDENLKEANDMLKMFEAIANLPIPTISVVHGTAYGGGVGIIAATDYAIASSSTAFCISETTIGLMPSVILPYLNRKMNHGQLLRLILSGRKFDAKEAKEYGLVEVLSEVDDLEKTLHDEVNQLLKASPFAQSYFKNLQSFLRDSSFQQSDETAKRISEIRASSSGKEGLKAFLEKKAYPWVLKLDEEKKLLRYEL
ncbi:MAG: enoyl-CoA hydratase/isomerase family protein [Oligoflexales bacterium]|nr:enoyl-CoA hydratase/isomerase family protein [Oligoflexales bacterium]